MRRAQRAKAQSCVRPNRRQKRSGRHDALEEPRVYERSPIFGSNTGPVNLLTDFEPFHVGTWRIAAEETQSGSRYSCFPGEAHGHSPLEQMGAQVVRIDCATHAVFESIYVAILERFVRTDVVEFVALMEPVCQYPRSIVGLWHVLLACI